MLLPFQFQIVWISLLFQVVWSSENLENVERLEKMHVAVHPLTVSGFSSGASMAHQLHVSTSGKYDSVGMFTGVFYRCTGDTKNASMCWNNSRAPSDSIEDAVNYERRGLIDSLSNLSNSKVFFWLGVQDDGMPSLGSRLGIITFYQNFIPSPAQIYTKLQSAYHLMPTNSVSHPCTSPAQAAEYSFLANCNYSGSYEALHFLIGPSIQPPLSSVTEDHLEPLRIFNQSEFFGKLSSDQVSMDDTGFLYVPKNCQENICLLHVFLHGCTLGRERVNGTFIQKSGYLEVAERNSIVMLFPQAKSTEKNPNGCWDYVGFTGSNYATKRGPQIVAINRMVDRLLHGIQLDPEFELDLEPGLTDGRSCATCSLLSTFANLVPLILIKLRL